MQGLMVDKKINSLNFKERGEQSIIIILSRKI